jgi:uncharacterized protein YcbK (DUF882 family)
MISLRFKQTGFQKKETCMTDQKLTYFTPQEVAGLDPEFCSKLDLARKFAAFPFVITSGLRTPEANQSTPGAVADSSHLKGLAVDLKAENDHEAYLIIAAGLSVGITRFGIYVDGNNVPTHVHLDVDPDKVPEVIWIRKEGAPYNSALAAA